MNPDKHHPCPICFKPANHWERYPRAVCRVCGEQASDEQGRKLSFFNESLSGGFAAIVTDTQEPHQSHTCYINGVECWADEARFGGIVIEAIHDGT